MRLERRHRRKHLLAAALVLVLAGWWIGMLSTTGQAKKKAAAKNILKSRSSGISVNHSVHVWDLGMSCESCHAKAKTSKHASDFLLPGHTVCRGCHEEAACKGKFVESCKKCHFKKPKSMLSLRVKHKKYVEVRFPHEKHLSGKITKETCLKCHAFKSKKNHAADKKNNPGLPAMKKCLGCHRHQKQYQAMLCDPCHVMQKGGTIKTKLASGVVLKPPVWMGGLEHNGLWFKQHEMSAANNSSMCAACHANEDCDACHAGTGKAKPAELHPDDWIALHGYSSMSGDLHCTSCHNLQQFCLPCHRRSGVAWDSPTGLDVPPGAVFHPQGWYSYSAGAGKHGVEARQSLTSCVSCHTEYDCMMCHAAPFQNFNPHPPSGIWHKKCKTLYSKNPGVCLKCHSSASPSLDQCK